MGLASQSTSKPGSQQNKASKPADQKQKVADHPDNKVAQMREIISQGNEKKTFVPESESTSTNFDGKQPEKNESGEKLDSKTQQKMESGFGTDFKDVRVHTGGEASRLADEADSKAFAHGQDVFFKEGEYKPGTKEGDALIAHELTHTVQQRGATEETTTTNEAQVEQDANETTVGVLKAILMGGKKIMPKMRAGLSVSRCNRERTQEQEQEQQTTEEYDRLKAAYILKRNQGATGLPPENPQVKAAAVSLGQDSVVMDSYHRFQNKEFESNITWGFFFSKDNSLSGSASKPARFNSWSDFNSMNQKQKNTLFQISRITGEVVHTAYSQNDATLAKLKAAYDYWPNGQYAIHQSGSVEASNTCNVFVGNALFNAGLTAHTGNKLWSAAEIYSGANGHFEEIDKAYAQPGDIVAYGGHVGVIVLIDPDNDKFVTREGYITPKGSERPRKFGELLGLDKPELKIMRKK